MKKQVAQVACGFGFTLATDAKCPRIWSTGLNTFSQLGRQLNGEKQKGELAPALDFWPGPYCAV